MKKEISKIEGVKLTLSVSRMKCYKDCERKYYYKYIEKLPSKEHDYFDLGSLVHGALELFHKVYISDQDVPENPAGLMKTAFITQQNLMEKDSLLSNEIIIEARDILKSYMLSLKQNGLKSKIICVEDDFNIKLTDDYSLQGFVDRLDVDNDGVYHIKDYKTNKNAKYMEPFQLQSYGIYLLNKYPDIDRFRGSYIMVKLNNQLVSYDFNKEDVIKIKKDIIKIADDICEEEKWTTRPTKLCDYCDYKGICFNTW